MAPALSDDTQRGRRGDEGTALPVGTTLAEGRYRLDGVLGRGGFGITYRATDLRLERPVAVKELFPEGARRTGTAIAIPRYEATAFARARERFRREATTLARFGHPNIVRIFAVLEENDTAYLVLERLEGRTLAAELAARRGPFTEAEALDVAAQAADALAAIHLAGVLHRDVSPANLVRTPDGRIVLIDFGLARPFAEDRTTMMTRIVTPGYASPEQHEGNGRFSARADVYSLGATLHRLLSGRTPPVAAERLHHDTLAPLWRVNPTVSHRTSDAVADALALDPAARPATVAVLLDRLGITVEGLGAPDVVDLRDDPTVAPEPPAPTPPDPPRPAAEDEQDTAAVADPADSPDPPPPAAEKDTAAVAGPLVPADPPAPAPAAPPTEVVRPDPADLADPPDLATEVVRPDPPSARVAPALAPTERGPGVPGGAVLAGAGAGVGSWVVPAPVDEPRVRTARPPRPRAARPAPLSPEERLELSAGAVPAGRRWITLPLALAAVALASASPVPVVAVLGLGVAPALATVGDAALQRHRSPAWWPLWWVRNVALGLVRSLGALLVLAVGLCLWFGTDAFDGLAAVGPWVLRATGVVAGGILALSIGRGGPGFRSHVALDGLTRRLLPAGRPTFPAALLVVVCLALVAAGLAFRPEAWPLR